MRTLKQLALVLALGVGFAACGDDDDDVAIDSGTDSMVSADASTDAAVAETFPQYVIRLVNTQTADNNTPDDHEARTLVDPMGASDFDSLFP